jgi:DNA polymerase III sliding clamp (beta) subunit (PCNA family)
MKINKEELKKALEIVKPGLANKEMIEQSASFAFMRGRVITYNDEISISHSLSGLEITGAVSASELYSLLGRITKDDIEIIEGETEIVLKAAKAKAGLLLQKEIRLPLEELGERGDWKKLPENFLEALQFCRFSCSKDMSRPILTCVSVNEAGRIESCDNVRLTQYRLNKKMPISTFLIPATSVESLVRYNLKEIATSKGWVHLRSTDKKTIFSCRIFEDNYPDLSGILASETPTTIPLPKTLAQVLDRASIFAKEQFESDSLITVTLGHKRMKVIAENDAGWFEEEINVKYSAEDPIEFRVNPSFLKESLDKGEGCEIGKDKIRFKGPNWEHIIALTPVMKEE